MIQKKGNTETINIHLTGTCSTCFVYIYFWNEIDLDRIITQIVKPKASVYMAIDGVAPRAKLNQQRSRRFRSAKDMAEATKDMPREMDESGNAKTPNVFDSNCITPGTEFLAKVSETIKYFIRKKIKEDPSWKHLQVIFSGHDIPGEGEHKIMEHIRMMKHQPGYRPNTRHCIYGQDADLIMLGLVTHEVSTANTACV